MSVTALIDGDIIVYSCGFAVETHSYVTPDGVVFSYIKQAKEHCQEYNLDPELIERDVDCEPLSHCLNNVKTMLNDILKQTGADDYKIFLTGTGNFREQIATIRKYKDNRTLKPVYKEAIISYLKEHWNAETVDGMEADDMLGICQDWDTVICTTDKDLNMIPGMHYNWRNKELYNVSDQDAQYAFYYQLLIGDTTDNIPGVPRVGPKTAEKLLNHLTTEEDMYIAALCAYEGAYEKPFEALFENARLLWILRDDADEWSPPL